MNVRLLISLISNSSNTISDRLYNHILPKGLYNSNLETIKSTIYKINNDNSLSLSSRFQEAAKAFAYRNIEDPDYGLFAGRLECCAIYCTAGKTPKETMEKSSDHFHDDYIEMISNESADKNYVQIVNEEMDFRHDYFAIKTLEKSYLLRCIDEESNSITVETPQQMWYRVALWLWYPNMERVAKTYDDLSKGNYVHASPTLFNSGLKYPMLTSCFLLTIDDSMESISKGWHDCAIISKNGGGIGMDVSRIRHGPIRGTGMSSGLVGLLKVYGEVLNYCNQSGRRQGSGTMFCPIWHKDVFDFIEMKSPNGPEDIRARNLFYSLWISDLFMKRVKENGKWTLFCPTKVPKLSDVYGKEFEDLYHKYENDLEKVDRTIDAQELWKAIILSQQETGGPFMLYKDAVNRKTNQSNLGTIRSSNLCVEIVQYSSDDEISSCNLGSVGLDTCVTENGEYNYNKLEGHVRDLVRNINQVVDKNYYPPTVPEVKNSNLKHRPLGIGVHGLADTFAKMDICWDSEKAKQTNKNIFEVMYYAYLSESNLIAQEKGSPYESFNGSPASMGILQFDLWGIAEDGLFISSDKWNQLRKDIQKYGLYNSLGIALMPTASSAQINGKNESFEMFTSNLYSRSVLSGQFMIVNKHLIRDLKKLNLWNGDHLEQIRSWLLENGGSMKDCPNPFESGDKAERFEFLKKKYSTVWETPQKILVDMSADRGPFVCQSQSLNCFMKDPTYKKLTSYHFYGWSRGLKTGMYYLRSTPATLAVNYAHESEKRNKDSQKKESQTTFCDGDVCIACSS